MLHWTIGAPETIREISFDGSQDKRIIQVTDFTTYSTQCTVIARHRNTAINVNEGPDHLIRYDFYCALFV